MWPLTACVLLLASLFAALVDYVLCALCAKRFYQTLLLPYAVALVVAVVLVFYLAPVPGLLVIG
ncbi:hypothetical protein BG74_06545 [Sodalis-like endosymbiont of Proechinophthirus fluctus]|nr:hypothetical protein BG74_06545 [Sodalis-like endosymbiont of Proechinophthirus fluctus]